MWFTLVRVESKITAAMSSVGEVKLTTPFIASTAVLAGCQRGDSYFFVRYKGAQCPNSSYAETSA